MSVVDFTDGSEGHTDFYSDGSTESWGSEGSYGYVDSNGYMTYYYAEQIYGAKDFKVPLPYSEDNYQFKENNNKEDFTAMDTSRNMLSIMKLNSSEFKELKNSPTFTDRYNSVDSNNYYSHKVKVGDSEIPNLYKISDTYKHEDGFYDTKDIFYLEIVEFKGEKYCINIGNPEINFINGDESVLKEWEDYLIKFNKENNLTPIKIKS